MNVACPDRSIPRRTAPILLAGLVALLAAGCAAPVDEAAPQVREVPTYSIEEFLGTVSHFGSSFSPDNTKVLVTSDVTGIGNVYAFPVDGGDPAPLTRSLGDPIRGLSYFPEDERFLYTADQGGNELNHIYVQQTDGTVRDLTPGENLKAQWGGWTADDTAFYILTNERDPKFFDLYRYAADGYERTLVHRNDDGLQFGAISPDESKIALVEPITTSTSKVHLLDVASGERTVIAGEDGTSSNAVQDFSPDGDALYLTSDDGAEFTRLVRHDLATGEQTPAVEADWDVMYAGFSRGGSYLVVGINNDARTEIRVHRYPSMERVDFGTLPEGDITSIGMSRDESMVALYVSTGRTPRELMVRAIDGDTFAQLTDSLNPGIDADHLVDPAVVRFASYDGVEIPGILYRPHAAGSDSKVPGLVWIHGGPGGQSRVGYSGLIQYLVNHGYAVYMINNRGSSGYGKTFFRMDDRRHGEADLGDVVASKQMLIDTGWVDPDRIGVIGGSYGGYLTLAALAFEPEVFDVGVNIFGVSNWLRTLNSIPPYWESFREALYAEMGDPSTDEERLRRISPLFHAENIVRPLMVLQGANDPRVLKVESDEIVAAAEANDVPVEYVVFDDEGHGFRKKDNRLVAYRKIREFLDAHLKGDGGVAEAAAEAS
jgi:prolyl oligopeptidase